jgi:hypothetical protein
MTRVVGVHGMAQEQKTRPALYNLWYPSMRGGIEIFAGRDAVMPTFELAFYGDVFLTDDAQGKPVAKRAASATALGQLGPPDDDEFRFLTEAVAEVTAEAGDEAKGVARVPEALQPLARRLTRRFSGSLVLTFITALRQVRLYLEDEDIAGRVRTIVTDAIDHETRVLVTHSLGTVVAFDALSRKDSPDVDTLITLGSPLAMRAVWSRLALRLGDASCPHVRRWVNIFDAADPVAAAGAVSRLWRKAEDFTVENGKEPHDVASYLGKRCTGRAIVDACP